MKETIGGNSSWVEAAASGPTNLRRMLGNFLTGVTVVACRDKDGGTRAFTANSFTSVSLEPPLVLVCIAAEANSSAVFLAANEFSISILGDEHEGLSRGLATGGSAKEELLSKLDFEDVPFLRGGLAVIHCRKDRLIEAGDHSILVGRVVRHRTLGGRPLGYFRGNYVRADVGTLPGGTAH